MSTANWIEISKVLENEILLIELSHEKVAWKGLIIIKQISHSAIILYDKPYSKKIKDNKGTDKGLAQKWFEILCLHKVIY